jgi:anaerobic dimethyl sulfoxide reductase subunit A
MNRAKKEIGTTEEAIYTTHSSHCGGACLLKAYVREGVVTRIETDDGDAPQFRACARGRAYRQRMYAPGRLLHPLKSVGPRGEGRFERVSWGEALDILAGELLRVKNTYGSPAILFKWSGGDTSVLHSSMCHYRLLNMIGGCSEVWGTFSFDGGLFAELATYGTVDTGNTRDDFLHSKLIIMWGWNPSTTIQNTNTAWYLAQAKEAGARIVSIDPRYTESGATFADEWIPIVPGTDAAMLVSMAYVMVKEELHDHGFLDKYTVGFDMFRQYLLGLEDGVPKTAAWAEAITGVPAGTIERLAREYATWKPAALIAGIGPGRTAYGEQYHRAAMALAAMTGNIGVHGGSSGGRSWPTAGPTAYFSLGRGIRPPKNPVELNAPPRKNSLPAFGIAMRRGQVNTAKMSDAILKGRAGGYPADYKLLYLVDTDYPNQYLNVNKATEALNRLEFVVVFEQFMTPGARFADLVLPTCTSLEKNDIALDGATGFYGYMNKVIDPPGEAKSHLQIAMELAPKVGVTDFNEKTEDEWLREIVSGSRDVPDYDSFKREGIYKLRMAEPFVAFRSQIEDPESNPFPTPSGKIEIHSQRLADMNDPEIPPIPKYLEAWESRADPLAREYPLQLITTHITRRAHSQYDNVPWLRELQQQAVFISASDAFDRGVRDGDMVRVFNARGEMVISAKVTERMMPGVVDIPQGAWYQPDERGVDHGGCCNVLTKDEHSPGGAFCSNTSLVQVERISHST